MPRGGNACSSYAVFCKEREGAKFEASPPVWNGHINNEIGRALVGTTTSHKGYLTDKSWGSNPMQSDPDPDYDLDDPSLQLSTTYGTCLIPKAVTDTGIAV